MKACLNCQHSEVWQNPSSTKFSKPQSFVKSQQCAKTSLLLQEEGFQEMKNLVGFYKENANILRQTFQEMGFTVFGGENAPYIWIGFPGQASWDVFADILEKCNIVTTPGSGFGQAGEGFVRASAFGHR